MACNLEELTKHYHHIIKHKKEEELKKFKNDLISAKKEVTTELSKYINMCNTILTNLGNVISNEFPDDLIISTYVKTINNLIIKEPADPISTFILDIYNVDEYRTNIIKGNDEFFINTDYAVDKSKSYGEVFAFKSCWKKMNDDMKNYIKKSMQTLVKVARQYIEVKYKLDEINKMSI
jgi:hypothetical protein